MTPRTVWMNTLSTLLGVWLLGGCAAQQTLESNESASSEVLGTIERAQSENRGVMASGSSVRVERPRVAGRKVSLETQDRLPEVFRRGLSYQTLGAETLDGIVRAVSGSMNMPIRMFEALEPESQGRQGRNEQSRGLSGVSFATEQVTFQYDGTFKGFLDEVSDLLDISWRYNREAGAVEFFRYETRVIQVMLPPGGRNVSASMNLGTGTETAGDVSVTHEVLIDPWNSLLGGVAGILRASVSAQDGRGAEQQGQIMVEGINGFAIANPDLALMTVSARPHHVDRVAAYVETVNRKFAANVLIDVRVLEVSLESGATMGFSFDILRETLGQYGFALDSADLIQPSEGTPGRILLETQGASSRGIDLTSSDLVIEALNQVGEVSVQNQGQVVAINGQPAPFQQAREINYIASSATTTIANAGVTTTITPGTRFVGFTANFLPLIMGDNRILLQYQLQMSSLLALKQVVSGENTITQLPEIASQSLQQQAFVNDGQTIMLFGFNQDRATNRNRSGFLSYSRATDRSRNMTVVLIQVKTSGAERLRARR